MKKLIFTALLFIFSAQSYAQGTFKAGWDTYKIGLLIHEYTYHCSYGDSVFLAIADSSQIMCSPDSLVVMTIQFQLRDNSQKKTINYLNPKKQVIKTEEYKGDNLLTIREWRYDDKNRKNYYYEENKATGKSFRKSYDYATDKKTGDLVVTESSFYNGRAEFYTKSYYDKRNVKYKEVRLNDNNKDVIHIETYTYGANGKVKERTVYFPEFKVTKKFTESAGEDAGKCSKSLSLGSERIYIPGKAIYLRNFMKKIQPIVTNPECREYEYKYSNFIHDIVVCAAKNNNGAQVVLRCKERMP